MNNSINSNVKDDAEMHIKYTKKIQNCQKSAKKYKIFGACSTCAGVACAVALMAHAAIAKKINQDTAMTLFAAMGILFYFGKMGDSAAKEAKMLAQYYQHELANRQKQR